MSYNAFSAKSGETGKRKLEITVVDARPMNEVGFRGEASLPDPILAPKNNNILKKPSIGAVFPDLSSNKAEADNKPTIIRPRKPPAPSKKPILNKESNAPSLIDFSGNVSTCPNVSSSLITGSNHQSSRYEGRSNLEILENLENERIAASIGHSNTFSKNLVSRQPTIIKQNHAHLNSSAPGPSFTANASQSNIQQKNVFGQSRPPPPIQPRTCKRTVTTTTTTVVKKNENPFGGMPLILPLPLGLIAPCLTVAAAEPQNFTTTTVTKRVINPNNPNLIVAAEPQRITKTTTITKRVMNPNNHNLQEKCPPSKPNVPVPSRHSSKNSIVSNGSTFETNRNELNQKKMKPKPPRPSKLPPARPPKPRPKSSVIHFSESTSALDDLMKLDSTSFHKGASSTENLSHASSFKEYKKLDSASFHKVASNNDNLSHNSSFKQYKKPPSFTQDLNSPSLPDRPGPGHLLYHYMLEGQPHGKVLFDYQSSHSGDLNLKVGEYVLLVRRVDDDWLCGRVNDAEGIFPSNYIEIIEPLPEEIVRDLYKPSAPEKPDVIDGPRCRARFDFDGETSDDLEFKENDVIQLIKRIGQEWARGCLNGKTGLFPLAFVEIIEDVPDQLETWGTYIPSASSIEELYQASNPQKYELHLPDENIVIAQYDFEGIEGELTFKTGDKITAISQVDSEWLYGEKDSIQGRFPAVFVNHVPVNLPKISPDKELENSKSVKSPTGDDSNISDGSTIRVVDTHTDEALVDNPDSAFIDIEPHCIVLYDYIGQTEGELDIKAGDRINLTSEVNEDWLEGYLGSKHGLVPRTFVNVIVELFSGPPEPRMPPPSLDKRMSLPSDSDLPKAVAVYDYQAQNDEELTIKAGDLIVLLERLGEDWLVGECNDLIGRFPTSYVDVLTSL